jgi:hypothetical protein
MDHTSQDVGPLGVRSAAQPFLQSIQAFAQALLAIDKLGSGQVAVKILLGRVSQLADVILQSPDHLLLRDLHF